MKHRVAGIAQATTMCCVRVQQKLCVRHRVDNWQCKQVLTAKPAQSSTRRIAIRVEEWDVAKEKDSVMKKAEERVVGTWKDEDGASSDIGDYFKCPAIGKERKKCGQSKEINVGGIHVSDDYHPPKAEEILNKLEEEQKVEPPKMFSRRKKAVSFHGVEPPKADDCMEWRLALKRSSACTNVSIMNLTDMDNGESTESEQTEEEGSEHTLDKRETFLGEADSETDLESLPSLVRVWPQGV
ncbi:hypothetical protein NDU88_010141 [Pleurodeles waltl]|uniref:Uncharacterized protein n=1 Tax=Pleurodeles waltl TaxID=8319 RepID=A0AAV7PZ68_PLEWA|nr:hypothetical protein NDU88_010141 [Pleurodeles waltl]